MAVISGRLQMWNARAAHRKLFSFGLAGVSAAECAQVNDEIGLGVKRLQAVYPTCNDRRVAAASRKLKIVMNHPIRRVRTIAK